MDIARRQKAVIDNTPSLPGGDIFLSHSFDLVGKLWSRDHDGYKPVVLLVNDDLHV
jgi:hypothetical protein